MEISCRLNQQMMEWLPSKDALLEAEHLVLVAVGCRLEDYCSDQTRTFWVGEKPTERFKKTLEAVLEAQHKRCV